MRNISQNYTQNANMPSSKGKRNRKLDDHQPDVERVPY